MSKYIKEFSQNQINYIEKAVGQGLDLGTIAKALKTTEAQLLDRLGYNAEEKERILFQRLNSLTTDIELASMGELSPSIYIHKHKTVYKDFAPQEDKGSQVDVHINEVLRNEADDINKALKGVDNQQNPDIADIIDENSTLGNNKLEAN